MRKEISFVICNVGPLQEDHGVVEVPSGSEDEGLSSLNKDKELAHGVEDLVAELSLFLDYIVFIYMFKQKNIRIYMFIYIYLEMRYKGRMIYPSLINDLFLFIIPCSQSSIKKPKSVYSAHHPPLPRLDPNALEDILNQVSGQSAASKVEGTLAVPKHGRGFKISYI